MYIYIYIYPLVKTTSKLYWRFTDDMDWNFGRANEKQSRNS